MGKWDVVLNVLTGLCVVALVATRVYYGDGEAEDVLAQDASALAGPEFKPPTPTSLTGPQVMRPVVGRCAYGTNPSEHFRYEFCGYRSVRQHSGNDVYSLGHWKGKWITKEEGGKTKFVGQEYEGGTTCGGGLARRASVFFTCSPDANAPKVLKVEAVGACHYGLTVGTSQWCEVEKEQQ